VLFKGTERRTAEQISAAVEAVGGELNAYTTKEYTCFYARVLRSDAELAVDVLADMIHSSVITAADVDAERAVIQDEIAMHADDPSEVVQEIVAGHVFGGSGLGRPVIGTAASIAALSPDQIRQHWQQHYAPSSLVVAAAGRVNHDRLVQQLVDLDAPPQATPPGPTTATQVRPVGGLVTEQRRVEQCSAVLAYPSVGIFDDARYPLGLLSLVLGGGMSSRLFLEVRERRGLTYGIDAGEVSYSDAGLWSVDWQCAPGKLAQIVSLVQATLAEVAEHGVTDAELERAKGQMRGQTVLSFESPSSRMSRLGGNTVLGDERTLAEVLDHFDAVGRDQVQAAAASLFSGPPVLGLVGPRVPAKVLRDWSS
jgi:predicted Zn-dependent peptidase